jgi:putative methyltransferase (TIGR04325 family)
MSVLAITLPDVTIENMATIDARALVVGLTPPVVLRGGLRLWHRMRGLGTHTFEGCYPTFKEAPCGENRYDDDEIARSIVAIALQRLRTADGSRPVADDCGQLLLPMVVSRSTGSLTVLDFGAGPARGLIDIINHVRTLGLLRLRYVMVETDAVRRAILSDLAGPRSVSSMIRKVLADKTAQGSSFEVRSDIPDALQTPLIVNAGSVLQYIEDYRATLAELVRLGPEFLIVSQSPVSDLPTYARVQLNIPHKKVAQWVFNREEFISDMAARGYTLIFSVDHDLALTHANAPATSEVASMIFRGADYS